MESNSGAFWREGPIGQDFVIEEVTPRFRQEAIDVIRKHATEAHDKPLFLYLAYLHPIPLGADVAVARPERGR